MPEKEKKIYKCNYKRYDGKRIYVVTEVTDVDTGMEYVLFKDNSRVSRNNYHICTKESFLGQVVKKTEYTEKLVDKYTRENHHTIPVNQVVELEEDGFYLTKSERECKGNETIARILRERQVLCPMAYWREKGINRCGKDTQIDPYKWGKTTVRTILKNQEYCGDVINFKTYSKNFKNKSRLKNPKENWVIFKDVHEPIIDRETFEMVQEIITSTKRRSPKKENSEKNMFADLLYCADCGSKLWYHTNTVNKDIHFFSCSNYVTDTRGTCRTRHYIRADAVELIVVNELRKMTAVLKNDEEYFAKLLSDKTNSDMIKEKKLIEAEMNSARIRCDTILTMYEKLYEDNVTGKVSDEWFNHLSRKYESDRMALKQKIADCEKKLKDLDNTQKNTEYFVNSVRKFMNMDRLTAPLLRELIDRIEVYEATGKRTSRKQTVVIYYKFIGYIDLYIPDDTVIFDTRQVVSVEYITRPEKTA